MYIYIYISEKKRIMVNGELGMDERSQISYHLTFRREVGSVRAKKVVSCVTNHPLTAFI